jgi:hypothetical protein
MVALRLAFSTTISSGFFSACRWREFFDESRWRWLSRCYWFGGNRLRRGLWLCRRKLWLDGLWFRLDVRWCGFRPRALLHV